MRILKSVFQLPPTVSPYTMLRTHIVQVAVFVIYFATDCLKKNWKIKCSMWHVLILHQIEGMQLSITSQFWNGELLQHFVRHFGTACCHYVHDRLYRNIISSLTHIWVLWNSKHSLSFLLFLKNSENQWQNIMGILKLKFKIRLSFYTIMQAHNLRSHIFSWLFHNIVERGKWVA